eukprot:scaffold23398_cov58-Attheya_sp.AAC.2
MGIPVDLGSAWIQGRRKNPIMKIGTDLNFTTYDEALKGYAVYDYEGSRLKRDELQAKKVLVTVPLGVLQSGAIQFIPQLVSQEKLNSIGKLDNGVMEKKILVYWEEDINIFWPKEREWLMKVAKTEAEQGNWTMFHNAYEVNGGKAILAGYVVGDTAKRVGTMTDDQVVKEALELLCEMFGANKVPDPKEYIVT